MRSKFTELIEQGVASRQYTPIASNVPIYDPFVRDYNKTFSIITDTHMSKLPNDEYVITGHMINTENWQRFLTSPFWGGVNIKQISNSWCLCDFLRARGFSGQLGNLNGDVVYYVLPDVPVAVEGVEPEILTKDEFAKIARSYTTSESQIPRPVIELVSNGDINRVYECYGKSVDEVAKNLNESLYIKGNNWIVNEGQIVGLIGDKVVYLNK